jgi:hypothetical protein
MPSDDDAENDLQWQFQSQSILGETPASVALEAIDGAIDRLRPHDRAGIRPAFAALAEGTWWVAALDERIREGLGGKSAPATHRYVTTRNASPDGQYVQAFLWARDRHTHQLPFSMTHDDTAFFGSGDNVLSISAGLTWRPSSELHEPEGHRHARAAWRGAYDALLAGKTAWHTLERCSRWFHWLAGHTVPDSR